MVTLGPTYGNTLPHQLHTITTSCGMAEACYDDCSYIVHDTLCVVAKVKCSYASYYGGSGFGSDGAAGGSGAGGRGGDSGDE